MERKKDGSHPDSDAPDGMMPNLCMGRGKRRMEELMSHDRRIGRAKERQRKRRRRAVEDKGKDYVPPPLSGAGDGTGIDAAVECDADVGTGIAAAVETGIDAAVGTGIDATVVCDAAVGTGIDATVETAVQCEADVDDEIKTTMYMSAMTPELWHRYNRQVKESEGFDVDLFPFFYRGLYPLLQPLPLPLPDQKCIKLAQLALNWHNDKKEDGPIELVKVVNIVDHFFGVFKKYITLEGRDTTDKEIKTYQALVELVPGDKDYECKMFRLKPPAKRPMIVEESDKEKNHSLDACCAGCPSKSWEIFPPPAKRKVFPPPTKRPMIEEESYKEKKHSLDTCCAGCPSESLEVFPPPAKRKVFPPPAKRPMIKEESNKEKKHSLDACCAGCPSESSEALPPPAKSPMIEEEESNVHDKLEPSKTDYDQSARSRSKCCAESVCRLLEFEVLLLPKRYSCILGNISSSNRQHSTGRICFKERDPNLDSVSIWNCYRAEGIHPIAGARQALHNLSTFCNLAVVTM